MHLVARLEQLGALQPRKVRIEVVGLENGTVRRLVVSRLARNLGRLEPELADRLASPVRVATTTVSSEEDGEGRTRD